MNFEERAEALLREYPKIARNGDLEGWVERAVDVVNGLRQHASEAKAESERLYGLLNDLKGKSHAARAAFDA